MKKYINGKMTISQILFASAFYAIIDTKLEVFFNWDNRYISGILGSLVTLIGYMLSIMIIRNEN